MFTNLPKSVTYLNWLIKMYWQKKVQFRKRIKPISFKNENIPDWIDQKPGILFVYHSSEHNPFESSYLFI